MKHFTQQQHQSTENLNEAKKLYAIAVHCVILEEAFFSVECLCVFTCMCSTNQQTHLVSCNMLPPSLFLSTHIVNYSHVD